MTFHGRSHARAAVLPMRIVASVLAILALGITSVSSPVPQAMGQDIPEVVGRAKPSVAFVFASGDQFRGSGTAFVVDPDGLLVTALHVVEDASRVSVVLPGDEPQSADVMGFDARNDVALLRINRSHLSPLALGDSDALQSGEEVLVIGYPLADALGTYDVTVTKGIISAIRPQAGPGATSLIQVDAAMNPGVSGGPVLNLRGQVVGIAVSGLSRAENVNFAGPVNGAKALFAQYLETRATSMPLRLPMTAEASRVLSYTSSGIGGGGHETKLGVSCIDPPQGAWRLSGLRVVLDSGMLDVLTWLSLGSEAPIGDSRSFARLSASGEKVIGRARVHLPADKVCLNYEAMNPRPLLPVGVTFVVKYKLEYRISPETTTLQDDPVITAAKAQIAATIRKQLFDLYQTQGLDALLARLRTSPAGDDLGTQTIRAERQRLLDIYEWDGSDALIAELRK